MKNASVIYYWNGSTVKKGSEFVAIDHENKKFSRGFTHTHEIFNVNADKQKVKRLKDIKQQEQKLKDSGYTQIFLFTVYTFDAC